MRLKTNSKQKIRPPREAKIHRVQPHALSTRRGVVYSLAHARYCIAGSLDRADLRTVSFRLLVAKMMLKNKGLLDAHTAPHPLHVLLPWAVEAPHLGQALPCAIATI